MASHPVVSTLEGQSHGSTQTEDILSLLWTVTEANSDFCFDSENYFKSSQQEVEQNFLIFL